MTNQVHHPQGAREHQGIVLWPQGGQNDSRLDECIYACCFFVRKIVVSDNTSLFCVFHIEAKLKHASVVCLKSCVSHCSTCHASEIGFFGGESVSLASIPFYEHTQPQSHVHAQSLVVCYVHCQHACPDLLLLSFCSALCVAIEAASHKSALTIVPTALC